MTSASFEMDNYMPDWTDDIDFRAFLNFPPDDVDQGDMSSIELPDAPLSVLTGEYDGTDAEIASYVTHRPLSLPPQTHYSISASLLEGSCSGNHLQPLHSSPRSVSPILTNDWDAIFDEDNCRDRVEMPGLGIGQEPPGASGPLGSTLANALAHGQSHECSYIACLSFGSIKDWPAHGMACRFPVCGYFTQDHSDHILHERDHSQKAGNETFCCVEHLCPFTSKRWPDLLRHYIVKHCTNPKKFHPCPVHWCKYSGNNGFARKDKLKSHYKNMHEGKHEPVKAGRVIKPAALKPQVSSFGGSAGMQKE